VSKSQCWGSILRNPWFWFRRMEHYAKLSEEHQKEWKDFCEKLSKLNLTKDIIPPLNYIYSKLEDSVKLNETYWNAIRLTENSSVDGSAGYKSSVEIVRIMAPLIGNPNVANKCGESPLHHAIYWGHTEIVKILAPLIDNPNAPDNYGKPPIHWATYYGHTEIVKILAPLTENPNAPGGDGWTPIHWAARNGHTEIVKILVPLTDTPNTPDEDGETPIHLAAENGHTEIVKILAPLTDNPNAPNNDGETPSSITKNKEIQRFLDLDHQWFR